MGSEVRSNGSVVKANKLNHIKEKKKHARSSAHTHTHTHDVWVHTHSRTHFKLPCRNATLLLGDSRFYVFRGSISVEPRFFSLSDFTAQADTKSNQG